jgi:manganese/zinc/iron transport system substrate-binding protein
MKKLLILAAFVVLGACSKATAPDNTATTAKSFSADAPMNVVATTGMVADAVKNVGGEFVKVTGLMGPGVDPHLYKASEGDIQRLSQADIIFYNGLNLEGKMGDILVKMARGRPTVAVTEDVDHSTLREPPEFLGHFDPHLWFDVKLWTKTIDAISVALGELDPAHAQTFDANATAFANQLEALDTWTRETLSTIPRDQRVLVTAHDAFGYFGRAYDVDVVALQGVSTVSEFGLADVRRIVDLLVERKIKAVFVESSIPKRSIEAVVAGAKARGHEVVVGGTLYSDAMGTPGTKEGTYVGMVQSNVRTITDALLGKVASK